ncbi:XRE family transcriptional regulator [Bacteroides salyersiae]|uniref:XRE family transcriptional regulator n=2 Tax=Bacteroides salyersiae TaxID=291644 RepID=UPI001C8BDCE0|nr:XRE family transcriptional regulator [Bacteroides salyersiae]UBD14679.1 XRE family transcriptional regulator [Bacteroides salyersiae]
MVHIGKIIEAELHRQERSVTWFAKKLYCERTNVYSIFKRQSIDTELLLRISQILKHNFFNYYLTEINFQPSEKEPIDL